MNVGLCHRNTEAGKGESEVVSGGVRMSGGGWGGAVDKVSTPRRRDTSVFLTRTGRERIPKGLRGGGGT